MIETIKVKPWGKDQGDFVVINADDFDPKIHTALAGETAPSKAGAGVPDPRPAKAAKPKKRKAK